MILDVSLGVKLHLPVFSVDGDPEHRLFFRPRWKLEGEWVSNWVGYIFPWVPWIMVIPGIGVGFVVPPVILDVSVHLGGQAVTECGLSGWGSRAQALLQDIGASQKRLLNHF